MSTVDVELKREMEEFEVGVLAGAAPRRDDESGTYSRRPLLDLSKTVRDCCRAGYFLQTFDQPW